MFIFSESIAWFSKLCFFAFVFLADAKVIQIPLTERHGQNPSADVARFSRHQHQLPLFPDASNHMDMQDTGMMYYAINATIGTPPQPFTGLIALDWSLLILPSVDCWKSPCQGHNLYNGSASSSYVGSNDEWGAIISNTMFLGNLSLDTLHFGGLDIKRQIFVDAHDVQSWGNLYKGFDGVIGLTPREKNTLPHFIPSPWQNIVDDGLLEHNIFTLSLPSGPRSPGNPRQGGELTVGGIAPKYADSDFLCLPLASESMWHVPLDSMDWDDGQLHEDFDEDYTLQFSSVLPYILLPFDFARRINKAIGAEVDGYYNRFPCERRERLPDLTFGVAGKKLVLTPLDYTFEMELSGKEGDMECFTGFQRDAVKTVVLGINFLGSFYMVFDQDEKEIRLTRKSS